MDYKKPQSTLVQGGAGIYPLTTADQVILADGSRLEKDGRISADSAANSAKLGGKAPEYYIQPRNLLDNSDFRNPVNQRGFVNGNAVEPYNYFIDRWISDESSINPSLNNNGIMPNGAFFQRLDNLSTYIGRNVTFAIGLSSGDIVVASGTLTDATVNDTIMFNTTDGQNEISVGSADGMWYVWINYPSSTIQWAALYEGSYTADTLPPYVPKGYAVELAECRLYYRPQQMYCLYCYSGGYAAGINFEPMRPGVIPTPVNAKAQTMTGDGVAGNTNIVVIQTDRFSYVENTNFTYGNYYRVFSEFSSDL